MALPKLRGHTHNHNVYPCNATRFASTASTRHEVIGLACSWTAPAVRHAAACGQSTGPGAPGSCAPDRLACDPRVSYGRNPVLASCSPAAPSMCHNLPRHTSAHRGANRGCGMHLEIHGKERENEILHLWDFCLELLGRFHRRGLACERARTTQRLRSSMIATSAGLPGSGGSCALSCGNAVPRSDWSPSVNCGARQDKPERGTRRDGEWRDCGSSNDIAVTRPLHRVERTNSKPHRASP